MKALQILLGALNFIAGGLIFPRFDYLRKTINLKEYQPYHDTRLIGLCFCLWPKRGMSSKEISSLDFRLFNNANDPNLMDIRVRDTKLRNHNWNHLSTISKGKDYSFIVHLDHKTPGSVLVRIEVSPSTHYNVQSLNYKMPRASVGYKF